MYFIIRTISKTDYVTKIKNEINIENHIKEIMESKIYHIIDDKGHEYYINTQYIEGFKIEK